MSLKALYYPGDVPFDTLYIPAIYQEIYYDGVYVDIMNVLDKEKKDPIIVDVGANLGIVTQYLREHAKKVYSIEPSFENFEALKQNKEFNNWDNVEVFKFAISDVDGKATIHRNVNNHTMNSIHVAYNDNVRGQDEEVETKKLTTFFKENNITHVDFMKMDVEGAEDIILRSEDFVEASKIIDNIEIEFHFGNWMELAKIMESLGYTGRRYACSAIVVDFAK